MLWSGRVVVGRERKGGGGVLWPGETQPILLPESSCVYIHTMPILMAFLLKQSLHLQHFWRLLAICCQMHS